MDRQVVESKAIRSMGYDSQQQLLEIEFRSGRIYQYAAVPSATYEWVLRAKDKGGMFNRLIRDRFAEREVTPAVAPLDIEALLRASLSQDAEPKEE